MRNAQAARAVIVLAVDTAGRRCGLAVWRDGTVLARSDRPMTRGHAEALMAMVTAALQSAGVAIGAVDLFAVTVGPGSFTGLRIGLAAVGGLALGCRRKIVGIGSFEAVAHSISADTLAGRRLLVALDSRRSEPFVQLFDQSRSAIGTAGCCDPAALAEWLQRIDPAAPAGAPLVVAGDAAEAAASGLPDHSALTVLPMAADPGAVAALAAKRARLATPDPPAPVYLRPPDARPAPPPRAVAP